MTLVQQITFITIPFIMAISLCGGWFAYHLTDTEFNRVFLFLVLWLFVMIEFSQLTKLGY